MSERLSYEGFKREVLNLPNLITIGRLFLIPPVVVLIDPTDPVRNFAAAMLFATASLLDILDGWLARRRNLVTVFGKFVDPLADKLMAMTVLIYLVVAGTVGPWLVALMLGRDFYINGIRSVAASSGVVIAAGDTGRAKTVFQLVGICCVLVGYRYRAPFTEGTVDFHWLGLVFLYVSLFLSITSAAQYTAGFRRALLDQRRG